MPCSSSPVSLFRWNGSVHLFSNLGRILPKARGPCDQIPVKFGIIASVPPLHGAYLLVCWLTCPTGRKIQQSPVHCRPGASWDWRRSKKWQLNGGNAATYAAAERRYTRCTLTPPLCTICHFAEGRPCSFCYDCPHSPCLRALLPRARALCKRPVGQGRTYHR